MSSVRLNWQAVLNAVALSFFGVFLFSVSSDYLAAGFSSFRLSSATLVWLRISLGIWFAGFLVSGRIRSFDSPVWLRAFLIVGFAWMLITKWFQHLAFETHAHDLGLFHTALWNTVHGHLMVDGIRSQIFFADHLMFFLFGLVPFYWIWAGPEVLFVASAIAFTLGIAAMYELAYERLRDRALAFLIACAFALNRYVWGAFLHEFHPDFFAPVFYFLLFLAFYRNRNFLFFFAMLMILALREDYALYLIPAGFFFMLSKEGRKKGTVLILVSALYAFLAFSKLIPFFHQFAGKETGYGYLGLWGHLGSGFGDVARNVLFHPASFLSAVCWPSVWKLVTKFLFLPFVNPLTMIFWLGPLLLNASSQFELMRQLSIHYGLIASTFAFAATVEGFRVLGAKQRAHSRAALFILACVLALVGMARYPVYIPKKEAAIIQATRPQFEEPACVQSSLFPHLWPGNFSIFPECSSDARSLILSPAAETYPFSRAEFSESLRELFAGKIWRIKKRLGNIIFFERNSSV